MPGDFVYGGIAGVRMDGGPFELGDGLSVRPIYAHLMSHYLMAFKKPEAPGQSHPAPWVAALGGRSFDIDVELKVPTANPLGKKLSVNEVMWWIAALLRIGAFPNIAVVAVSDHPFDEISQQTKPTIQSFESIRRFGRTDERHLDHDDLNWVKQKWLPAGKLFTQNKNFAAAMRAYDSASEHGRSAASMLALWAAIEVIFTPTPGETRFRVATMLASYLEPPGATRLETYKEILELYNVRSKAAHSAAGVEDGALLKSMILARNALVRMVDEIRVPTQQDLENLAFIGAGAATPSEGSQPG
ncbi:HEPN domain-containing protein [Bradyrhizobium iriomotense]|uniref:HEPN domain-containing protein n=1 Tax=Bradyrhizobium iriomotense TaxID=441950 RepID=UPI001B8A6E72|nr:HEPN domain-containing protein [Bradyrhizobium iriomotense]MBR1128497.1 hypothetical protein [Bradyrhizobium iriomotense]